MLDWPPAKCVRRLGSTLQFLIALASGNSGDDADFIPILQRRMLILQETNVFFVHVNIDETAHFAFFIHQAFLDARKLRLQFCDHVADSCAIDLHERGQKNGLLGSTIKVVGKFKGLIRILNSPDEPPLFDLAQLLSPKGYRVRLYVLRALKLTAMDMGFGGRPGLSDPYLKVALGKEKFDDRENHIDDVVDANVLVLGDERAAGRVFNVGGGKPVTTREFSDIVMRQYGSAEPGTVTGEYRFGDTRHIYSDTSALRELGWAPRRGCAESVAAYAEWLKGMDGLDGVLAAANAQMRSLGVVRKATG